MKIQFGRKQILLMINALKIYAYGALAIFLYVNIIGAEGIVDLFKIENPLEEGLNNVNINIPSYVLKLTFLAVCLEFLSNLLEMPDNMKIK